MPFHARAPLLLGIGNLDRGDDAAGLLVARRVRAATQAGGVTVVELGNGAADLIDAWDGADRVIVVDAVCSGAEPGTVHRFDGRESLPAGLRQRGTHGFGVAGAVELARALGRLPARLAVFGIEGADFGLGRPLTSAVAAAIDGLVAELDKDLG